MKKRTYLSAGLALLIGTLSVIKLIVKDAPLETREAIMWYGKTESFKQVIIYQNDYGLL